MIGEVDFKSPSKNTATPSPAHGGVGGGWREGETPERRIPKRDANGKRMWPTSSISPLQGGSGQKVDRASSTSPVTAPVRSTTSTPPSVSSTSSRSSKTIQQKCADSDSSDDDDNVLRILRKEVDAEIHKLKGVMTTKGESRTVYAVNGSSDDDSDSGTASSASLSSTTHPRGIHLSMLSSPEQSPPAATATRLSLSPSVTPSPPAKVAGASPPVDEASSLRKGEREQLQVEVRALRGKLDAERSRAAEAIKACDELSAEVSKSKAELKQLRADRAGLEAVWEGRRAELEERSEETEAMLAQMLADEVAKVRQEHEEVHRAALEREEALCREVDALKGLVKEWEANEGGPAREREELNAALAAANEASERREELAEGVDALRGAAAQIEAKQRERGGVRKGSEGEACGEGVQAQMEREIEGLKKELSAARRDLDKALEAAAAREAKLRAQLVQWEKEWSTRERAFSQDMEKHAASLKAQAEKESVRFDQERIASQMEQVKAHTAAEAKMNAEIGRLRAELGARDTRAHVAKDAVVAAMVELEDNGEDGADLVIGCRPDGMDEPLQLEVSRVRSEWQERLRAVEGERDALRARVIRLEAAEQEARAEYEMMRTIAREEIGSHRSGSQRDVLSPSVRSPSSHRPSISISEPNAPLHTLERGYDTFLARPPRAAPSASAALSPPAFQGKQVTGGGARLALKPSNAAVVPLWKRLSERRDVVHAAVALSVSVVGSCVHLVAPSNWTLLLTGLLLPLYLLPASLVMVLVHVLLAVAFPVVREAELLPPGMSLADSVSNAVIEANSAPRMLEYVRYQAAALAFLLVAESAVLITGGGRGGGGAGACVHIATLAAQAYGADRKLLSKAMSKTFKLE